MVKRVDELIHFSKEIDGIDYKVTKDTLRKTKKRKATPKRRSNSGEMAHIIDLLQKLGYTAKRVSGTVYLKHWDSPDWRYKLTNHALYPQQKQKGKFQTTGEVPLNRAAQKISGIVGGVR